MLSRGVKETIPGIPVNSIKNLTKSSSNAFEGFDKRREELLKVNVKISKEISDRNSEIEKLTLGVFSKKRFSHFIVKNPNILLHFFFDFHILFPMFQTTTHKTFVQ